MPELEEAVHIDPFNPVLKEPNPLAVTDEQKLNIRYILEYACSDSRFVQKAYLAILLTLQGEAVTPVLISLSPDTGTAGSPAIPITVTGTDFDSGASVQQAGVNIPTNYVDDTTLTATLDLSGAAEGVLAINVKNSNHSTSNTMNFTVTPQTVLSQSLSAEAHRGDKFDSTHQSEPMDRKGE